METESIYVEVPVALKRALEDLVTHYKRRRQRGEPRNLSAVVRRACDELLTRELPGYVSALAGESAPPATGDPPAGPQRE